MAPKKQSAEIMDILSDLAKDSKPSAVQYLKDGDTTIKMVLPPGRTDVRGFYQRFLSTFKEGQFPYYLICGVITQADEDGIENPELVRFIKVTKGVLVDIANIMGNRWKPLTPLGETDPRDCLIVINKGKKSGKVAYSVTAIPEAFEWPLDSAGNKKELRYPEISIEQAAADQEESSAARDLDATPADTSETIK